MIGSFEKYNKIILMEEFSDIPFFIQQQEAMRKQLIILECLLQSLQDEKPNEHNMVTIFNTEDYINAIQYAKTMQIYNLKKRIEKYSKTGDPEIVRILNAICKGEFYIVYEPLNNIGNKNPNLNALEETINFIIITVICQ